MNTYKPPVLPESLQPFWAERPRLEAVHRVLQDRDVALAAVPESTWPDPDNSLRLVDFCPTDVEDPAKAIVMPSPFATGHAPHMSARALLVQAAAEHPTRLASLPNSVTGAPALALSHAERARIHGGDYTPWTDRALRALEDAGVEQMQVVGYSQAATLGAALMNAARKHFDVGHSTLLEPANMQRRTPFALGRAFVATGTAAMERAMGDSRVPWLHSSLVPSGVAEQARSNIAYMRTMGLPENRAIGHALSLGGFQRQVIHFAQAEPSVTTLVVRAETSTVLTADSFEAFCEVAAEYYPDQIHTVTVEGYGHELGDQIAALGALCVPALLGRAV